MTKTWMEFFTVKTWLRGGFKTQPPVDRRFRPVPRGCHCLEQYKPGGTGRNRQSTGGWVVKPPLNNDVDSFVVVQIIDLICLYLSTT